VVKAIHPEFFTLKQAGFIKKNQVITISFLVFYIRIDLVIIKQWVSRSKVAKTKGSTRIGTPKITKK
jgi:hypothetical protein